MLLKNKKVAIIGAGPVGLTMAKLLQQKGVNLTIYERDKDALVRVTGGTLDLHKGSGQDALKEADLLNRYYEMALPMGRTVADEQGNILFSSKPTDEDKHNNPEINRNDLRKILLNSLVANTVVWDRKLTGIEEKNGQWLLHFENGTNAIADFVIGANGGMSAVRKYVTDAAIEYTGTMILQGDVLHADTDCPDFMELCNDTILMAANKGSLLVANPRNGSLLSYSIIFKKPEEWETKNGVNIGDTDSIITYILNRCVNWHESYKQLFRATSSFVIWSTRKIPLDKPWKKNRPLPITLIGDAAHIMPPFAGQGVNTGLRDALILSDELTNGLHTTIENAIDAYEQKMFVYATEAQNETSKNEIEMRDVSFSFQKFYEY